MIVSNRNQPIPDRIPDQHYRGVDAGFFVNVLLMKIDGRGGDSEALGNLLVGEAFANEPEDFHFAVREGKLARDPAELLLELFGIGAQVVKVGLKVIAVVVHRSDGFHQRVEAALFGKAGMQAVLEGIHGMVRRVVHGEQHHLDTGIEPAQLAGQLGAVHLRHLEVGDHNIRRIPAHQLQHFGSISRLAGYPKIVGYVQHVA